MAQATSSGATTQQRNMATAAPIPRRATIQVWRLRDIAATVRLQLHLKSSDLLNLQ